MPKFTHTLEEKKIIVDQVETYQEKNNVTIKEACAHSDVTTANYYAYRRQLISKGLLGMETDDDRQMEILQVTQEDIRAAKEEIKKDLKPETRDKMPKKTKNNDELHQSLLKKVDRMERLNRVQQQMIQAQQEMISIQNEGGL